MLRDVLHQEMDSLLPLVPGRRQGMGRNAPCPCGSGKKYKHCCLLKVAKVRSNVVPSSLFSHRGRADWSPTARLDEHRLNKRFTLFRKWVATFPRLAVDAWPCRCGRHSDPLNPGRSFFSHPTHRLSCNRLPGRALSQCDGETQCSKVRSDEVQDGSSLRSQATTGPCGLSNAGAEGGNHPLSVFLCVRVRRAKETDSPRSSLI
jgi:SEC-C motif-containing protein